MYKKIALAAALVIGAPIVALYFVGSSYDKQLAERFPEIPVNVRRKAYIQFFKNAYLGKYGDMDAFDDEKMDGLYLELVHLSS